AEEVHGGAAAAVQVNGVGAAELQHDGGHLVQAGTDASRRTAVYGDEPEVTVFGAADCGAGVPLLGEVGFEVLVLPVDVGVAVLDEHGAAADHVGELGPVKAGRLHGDGYLLARLELGQ